MAMRHLMVVLAVLAVPTLATTPTPDPGSCGRPNSAHLPQINGYNRVINGEDAVPHSWPWIVSLQSGGSHFCGGSLINDQWVLTAAHCTELGPQSFQVVLGQQKLDNYEGTQKLETDRVIPHEDFNIDVKPKLGSDIALIKLKTPAEFGPTVSPVCLAGESAKQDFPAGTICVVAGWGRTNGFGNGASKILQQAAVQLRDDTYCAKNHFFPYLGKHDLFDHSTTVCTNNGKTGGCQGDSGGPLVCEKDGVWTLVGAVSGGSPVCNVKKPSYFADVAGFKKWIDENMAKHSD